MRLTLLIAVTVFAIFLGTGCAAPSYNVEVFISNKFLEQYGIYPTIEMDMVGADVNEAERLDACDINDYFQIGNALRTAIDHVTVQFSEGNVIPKRIDSSHPIWKKLARKETAKLYFIVNTPQITSKQEKGRDTRKKTVPLEREWWRIFGAADCFIEISPAGINKLTARPDESQTAQNEQTTEGK